MDKRYEEALERAKEGKPLDEVFPELKESEDDRIINAIIGILKNSNAIDINVSQEKMIAWLEKQKEQKDYRKLYEDIAKSEWFKKAYVGKSLGEYVEQEQKSIEDSEDERIRKEIISAILSGRVYDVDLIGVGRIFQLDKEVADKWIAYLEKQKDEVQKQFNLGVQAGREEAMYEMEKEKMGEPKEWADELSAEIDRISKRYPEVSFAKLSRVAVHFSRWQKEQQTPDSLLCDLDLFASSREDCEKIRVHIREIRKIIAGIPDEQKTAEWSEEDEKIREELYEYFRQLQLMSDRGFSPSLSLDDILSWLKSLRPQPHWKPSGEQMSSLWQASIYYKSGKIKITGKTLESLYNELSKL